MADLQPDVYLTEDDFNDLESGFSITTLSVIGSEVDVFPEFFSKEDFEALRNGETAEAFNTIYALET